MSRPTLDSQWAEFIRNFRLLTASGRDVSPDASTATTHFEAGRDGLANTYEDLADVLREESKYNDAEAASRQALALDVKSAWQRQPQRVAASLRQPWRYRLVNRTATPEPRPWTANRCESSKSIRGTDDPSNAITLNSLGKTLKDEDSNGGSRTSASAGFGNPTKSARFAVDPEVASHPG